MPLALEPLHPMYAADRAAVNTLAQALDIAQRLDPGGTALAPVIDVVKAGASDGLDPKMQALLHIARVVGKKSLELTANDIAAARSAGASDGDVQLAVLNASGFSMYNRMVDGLRAMTAPTAVAYAERAAMIAEHGYSAAPPPGAPPAGQVAPEAAAAR